ncbi:MAG: DinB family protein [Ferruginibacter sp.]
MKKLLLVVAVIAGLSFVTVNDPLTEKERQDAAKFLTETEDGVLNAAQGLTDAQLKYKPAADKWSVEDNLKHISMTEMMLWYITDSVIKSKANPEKRADIKMTDDDVKKNIEDRSHKVKTFAPLEPQNTPFKSAAEAIASFKENRGKLIEYIRTTGDELRNHVAQMPPGSFDCYQMVLFIGAHSNRHMQQINEVKADPGFPK